MNILKLAAEHPWAIQPSALEQAIIAATEGMKPEAAAPRPMRRAGAVAVVPLQGVLRQKGSTFMDELFGEGGGSTDRFAANIRRLAADDSVGTIVIDIHSPGGEVFGTQEAADAVSEARGKKKVIAIANSLAASAAYWIGSQATEFIGTPSSQTGSIGVFAMHEDISAMAEKMGVKVTLISAGKFKTEGNQFEPLSDDAKAAVQKNIDAHYGQFVAAVAKGRKVSQAAVRDGFGQGRVLTAKDARAAGMIDRVGTMRDVLGSLSVEPDGMVAMAEHNVCDGAWRAESCGDDAEYLDEGLPACQSHSRDASEGYDVRALPDMSDHEAQHQIERERMKWAEVGA